MMGDLGYLDYLAQQEAEAMRDQDEQLAEEAVAWDALSPDDRSLQRSAFRYARRHGGGDPARTSDLFRWYQAYYGRK